MAQKYSRVDFLHLRSQQMGIGILIFQKIPIWISPTNWYQKVYLLMDYTGLHTQTAYTHSGLFQSKQKVGWG